MFNNSETTGSIIYFLDENTNELMQLNEYWLQKYDGTPKRFVNGDLITNTSIENILLNNSPQ